MPQLSRRTRWNCLLTATAVLAAAGWGVSPAAHPPQGGDDKPYRSRTRGGYDPATGRDLLNYPPHRSADLLHQRIELVVPDMNTPRVIGSTTIRFTPIAGEVAMLKLHAADLFIKSAMSESRATSFDYAPGDDTLSITFDPPVPGGTVAEVRIDYEVNDPAEGLIWSPQDPLRGDATPSFHSQGEPESNRYWFPTFDFPSERLSSEIIVTVPAGFTAVSNGRLVSRELVNFAESGAEAERYHYQQAGEHVPYLISLCAGKWDVQDVAPKGRTIPMPVYVPLGEGDRIAATFGRTPAMMSLLARLYDEPYPWEKYAQVAVRNFAWGGMENTGATTLYDTVALDTTALLDGDEDELILHELAHQWFGNLITCRSWEHIWLNEGWATFSEALWAQYQDARAADLARSDFPPTARLRADDAAYQVAIWNWYRDVIDNDQAAAPFQPAMVSKEYPHPDMVFGREANPYPKGAAVLHMLRQRLGEETFWRGVHLYLDRHRNQSVETFQFRLCMEDVSGLSLQRFFDQWCYRPGVPRLRVSHSWDSATRTLTITAEQTQPIDGPNPAFAIDLPVWIDAGEGRPREIVVTGDDRVSTATVTLPREPRTIVVDPGLSLLADLDIDDAPEQFIAMLRDGPTLASKMQAIRELETDPGTGGVPALAALVRDGRVHRELRVHAMEALGRMAAPPGENADPDEPAHVPDAAALSAIAGLASENFSDARVRRAVVKAIGDGGRSADRDVQARLISSLSRRWSDDPSYAVRAECLRALGRLKAVDAIPLFDAGLRTDSQHDQIREAAIDAWKESKFPDGFSRVAAMTTPNHSRDARQAAIRAVGELAERDPERAFNLLAALVNDRDMRTRRVAVETLLKLDDPRAVPTIDQWTDAARSRSDKAWGRELLRKHAEEAESDKSDAGGS